MNPPPLVDVPPVTRQPLLGWLNLLLALFLVDAALGLLDDLSGLGSFRPLMPLRALSGLGLFLAGLVTYLLMGISPSIPKRWFLPLTLAGPFFLLLSPLLATYFYSQLDRIAVLISLVKLGWGGWVVWSSQGALRLRWPLIRPEHLGTSPFRWPRLIGFGLLNVGLILPGILLYLGLCAHLAVDHFSRGFLRLDATGISGIAKKYARADGKVIQLIPMMHVGESTFYEELSKSFPSNSIILLEGVTDKRGRLKNKLSYKKVAESVGLAEQQDTFEPAQGETRRADVDIAEFGSTTIDLLNLIILIHSQEPTPKLIQELMEKGQDRAAIERLWEDLLTLRNAHLLGQIREALADAPFVMVPWGAAHMPGVSAGIEKEGFKLVDRQEYRIARFRVMWDNLWHRGR